VVRGGRDLGTAAATILLESAGVTPPAGRECLHRADLPLQRWAVVAVDGHFGPGRRLVADMRWLILLAAIGAGALALQILIWERRGGRRQPSTLGRVAFAVLAVVLVGGAVYSAHLLGIFSIPLVVIAFVPVGVTARWLILATRGPRLRAAEARAATAQPLTRRARLLELAALPVFVVLVAAVVVLALAVGTLVGKH